MNLQSLFILSALFINVSAQAGVPVDIRDRSIPVNVLAASSAIQLESPNRAKIDISGVLEDLGFGEPYTYSIQQVQTGPHAFTLLVTIYRTVSPGGDPHRPSSNQNTPFHLSFDAISASWVKGQQVFTVAISPVYGKPKPLVLGKVTFENTSRPE